MQEISLEKAKEIVIEPTPDLSGAGTWRFFNTGYVSSMLKFSRLLMASEVYHVNDIEDVQRHSHDLLHLSGIHKMRKDVAKAGALRFFWGQLWEEETALKQIDGLKQYIVDVLENSAYKGGWSKRPLGLLRPCGRPHSRDNYPWRDAAWYAARKPKPFVPLTEFYPYISTTPTEDHELLLAVDRLVPKGLNPDTRADVCQDMLVAVLSGDVSLDNLAGERPKYMKQFFKMFPAKYGHLSLDAPLIYGGDITDMTLGETIAAEYK